MVGVYFESGLGYKTATHFLNAAMCDDGVMWTCALSGRDDFMLFDDYVAAMKLAGRYAYAGRDWVCDRVVRILGAAVLEEVHNHHNFAWREEY